jgi:hypothetical protein
VGRAADLDQVDMPMQLGGLFSFPAFSVGYITTYPLAPLPQLLIVIHLDLLAAPNAAAPLLAITWYEDALEVPPLPPSSPTFRAHSPPAPCRQPCRRTRVRGAPTRASTKQAAIGPANYVDMTARAVQRRALRDNLATCSEELKRQVSTRKFLKRKTPLGALDLGRLAKAVGLGCADKRVVSIAAATGCA